MGIYKLDAFTLPQIASQMIREIKAMGFEIDCVLADSLYGESTSTFMRCLQGLNLQFALCDSE